MNRTYAADYLARFAIPIEDVGEVVSEGTQHYTCRYGSHRVIKIPKDSLYMRTYRPLRRRALLRDLELLNTQLPQYVAPTEIHFVERSYIIVQDFYPGAQYITIANFASVAADFHCILDINRGLVRDHAVSLDFFGSIGFRQTLLASLLRQHHRAKLTNLLAVPQGTGWTIRIVDVNLSELRYHVGGDINLFHWAVDRGVYHVTDVLLRDHYGVGLA